MIGKTRVCPNANPFFYGASFSIKEVNTAGTHIATEDDFTILANATAGSITITLPDPTTCKGRVYVIKRTDATSGNTVTAGTKTVSGFVIMQSDGTNWQVIAE